MLPTEVQHSTTIQELGPPACSTLIKRQKDYLRPACWSLNDFYILTKALGTTESVLYILQIPSNSATYSSSLGLNNGTTLFPPTFLLLFHPCRCRLYAAVRRAAGRGKKEEGEKGPGRWARRVRGDWHGPRNVMRAAAQVVLGQGETSWIFKRKGPYAPGEKKGRL